MSAEIVLFIRLLTTILTYLFLAASLFILWKSTFVSKNKPEQEFPTLKLSNMSDNSSKLFSSPEIYIGRDENANFIVDDDSVSNIHNRIFWKEQAFWIEDLNSTNGTILNDEKLVSPVALYSGDIIKCGTIEIEVEIEPGSLHNKAVIQ